MKREITIPKNEYMNIRIPKAYIDRKIEILIFPIDNELEESPKELSTLMAYSNHSANLVDEWLDDSEDNIWT